MSTNTQRLWVSVRYHSVVKEKSEPVAIMFDFTSPDEVEQSLMSAVERHKFKVLSNPEMTKIEGIESPSYDIVCFYPDIAGAPDIDNPLQLEELEELIHLLDSED